MNRDFGDLEADVIDRIWDRHTPTTVREVLDVLSADREIAYTTVMTTMDNLHHKGWLERERVGRAYRYRPVVTREEYSAGLMRRALGEGRNPEVILAHFVAQMSPEQSDGLRRALRRRSRVGRR